jgi:amidase
MVEPLDLDGMGQAELVRTGQVSAGELVDAAITRIEKINPLLNAVITPLFDKARQTTPAAGPFAGVPMLLKDLACHSAGDAMYEGMGFLRAAGWVEEEDSYLAAGFRRAGFVFLGKTNTPELGILPTTEPLAFGPTRNPWNDGHSTGGSSGGSAAAVAAGLVAIAHANDGGGSIRIPASECGLVGLKPTRGRTSLGPDYGDVLGGLVCEHVVTRSVRDSAAVLDCVAGYRTGDPFGAPGPAGPWLAALDSTPAALRIGVMTAAPGGSATVHPECVTAAEDAARLLDSLGHRVEQAHPAALDDPDWIGKFIELWAAGNAWSLEYWERKTGRTATAADVEPLTWALIEMGRGVSAPQWLWAREWLQASSRRLLAWWDDEGFDLLLTPTIAIPPPKLGFFDSPADNPLAGLFAAGEVVPFTPPFNVSGQPAISLPLSWSKPETAGAAALPIGVQLVGAMGAEDLLLRVAAQVETARPWARRRPPISAFTD